eukprot:COSAG06_NODE_1109_length_10653_cov_103.721148_7_plen_109_part_00
MGGCAVFSSSSFYCRACAREARQLLQADAERAGLFEQVPFLPLGSFFKKIGLFSNKTVQEEAFVLLQAEKHFRSALRLSPTDARAKAGCVRTLSRHLPRPPLAEIHLL